MTDLELKKKAIEVRKGLLEAIFSARTGHPGGSLSAADVLTYLYFEEMDVSPDRIRDEDRDRFVLSKGHAAPVLYSVLAVKGILPRGDLKTLRHTGAYLQGHPDMKHTPGIDMSTGSLGQGISAATGIALAAKLRGKSYRTYVLVGDGELQEGQAWEAAMFASSRMLSRLTVIVDNNGLQIDGKVEDVCNPYPIDEKFKAFGFHTISVDGHDFVKMREAFREARQETGKPTAIILKTVKGKGISFMENIAGWHGKAPNQEEYRRAVEELEKAEEELCER